MTEKTPLLLLPGLLCDRGLWRHQIESLADIAEPRVADLTRADSMAGMARSVLADAPPRFALAGLSMGGYCALEIMRQAPERVERLALLDTSARPDTPEQTKRRRELMELSRRGKFKGVTSQLLPLLIHSDRLEDKDLTGEILAMAERIGPEAFLRQQQAIMNRPDSRPDLAKINCPALVLCGRQDALTAVDIHREIVDGIADAYLVVVDNCGHLSPMEQPGEVSTALREWLS